MNFFKTLKVLFEVLCPPAQDLQGAIAKEVKKLRVGTGSKIKFLDKTGHDTGLLATVNEGEPMGITITGDLNLSIDKYPLQAKWAEVSLLNL